MHHCIVCNSDYSESLAICPKCGFVPDASLVGAVKDEYPKHDPNVPDLKKYWCRECRGHHDTILCGTTDEKTLCKNCRSDDVHLVRLNITKSNFFIGDVNPLALPAAFSFCVVLLILVFVLGTWAGFFISLIFPAIVLLLGHYDYKEKLAVRNEWLDWAKERGFDENAENR